MLGWESVFGENGVVFGENGVGRMFCFSVFVIGVGAGGGGAGMRVLSDGGRSVGGRDHVSYVLTHASHVRAHVSYVRAHVEHVRAHVRLNNWPEPHFPPNKPIGPHFPSKIPHSIARPKTIAPVTEGLRTAYKVLRTAFRGNMRAIVAEISKVQ